jgi:raffinose/stachyose/melibiose transport system permease protein
MSQVLNHRQEKTKTSASKFREARRVPASRVPASKLLARIPLWMLIGLLLVIEIYPLLWLLLSSFKTSNEFSRGVFWSLPTSLDWQNYVQAWTSGMGTYFLNSILAVFPALFLVLLLSLAASFGLEVMKWRGNNIVLLAFLAGIMIPAQMVLLPLFTMYFQTGLIDTLWSLIITYTAFSLPLSVFLMAGFFKGLPRGVIEAAVLDGASIYQIFSRVAVPMVANGLVTIALVDFFVMWNDLLFSLTFISDDSRRTIQTGLLSFTGQYGQVQWGPTFAGVALAVFPTLVVYLILNQQVIKGLTAGSVKG